jgi:hypothetical protein
VVCISAREPFEYKELPIESVEVDEEAKIRVFYDTSDLVESIRMVGQLMPGYAYKDGDKYKVFVGIRRLLAVKELYEREGSPTVFKAYVFEKKPENFYEMIREENAKRSDLTGLDKLHIILKYSFANKILSARDVRLIPSIRAVMRDVSSDELYELALVEQRAKAHGFNNHFSLEELLFLFRDLHSLEERKLFAIFFLVYRLSVKHVEAYGVKMFAISKVELLTNEDLQIAGLSKEDVDKIIAMYQAPPYQAEILQEPESEEEQPEERSREIETSEDTHEGNEGARETNENKLIVNMDRDVKYEIINGQKVVFVREESGILTYRVKDGQELEIKGVKVRITYGGDSA